MSNLIKAYAIKYDTENKRIVDTNVAAIECVKRYEEKLNNHEEFVQGLVATTVEEIPEEEKQVEQVEPKELSDEHCLEETITQIQTNSPLKVEEEAKRIIQQAKEEVIQMLQDAKSQAVEEKQKILEDAKRIGYEEGVNLARKDQEDELKRIKEKEIALEKDYKQKCIDLEPKFAELLIAFLRRFTGVIFDDKKDIILYLIEQELLSLESSNSYLIHVSKEDFDMVNSKKNEIKWRLKEDAQIDIIEDRMLSRAQCLIETDSRIIDCSLDVQLKNLISDLKLLSKTEGHLWE